MGRGPFPGEAAEDLAVADARGHQVQAGEGEAGELGGVAGLRADAGVAQTASARPVAASKRQRTDI